jgi:hypothetical protein
VYRKAGASLPPLSLSWHGAAEHGNVRHRPVWRGSVRHGFLRSASPGLAGLGRAWSGMGITTKIATWRGSVMQGGARQCEVGLGVLLGMARLGQVGHRPGGVWHSKAGRCSAPCGEARGSLGCSGITAAVSTHQGRVRLGWAWCGRAMRGKARSGAVRCGDARYGAARSPLGYMGITAHVSTHLGVAWRVEPGLGLVGSGGARHGTVVAGLGTVWSGLAVFSAVRHGWVRYGRGSTVASLLGGAGQVGAWQGYAWRGQVGLGTVPHGEGKAGRGTAWSGRARPGLVRQGTGAVVSQPTHPLSWQGTARSGCAR